jgi:NADH-quinone oxidoreductase subunit A
MSPRGPRHLSRLPFDYLREKIHELDGIIPESCLELAVPLFAFQPEAAAALDQPFELSSYYPIFMYLGFIVLFAIAAMIMAHAVGPHNRTRVKLMPYESGMDPIGDSRQHFDVKFYLIAILFLVFDVELLFLYPWAVVAYNPDALLPIELRNIVFVEILVFLATLVLAYVYAWRKGVFRWR